jgi:hypothetical protein
MMGVARSPSASTYRLMLAWLAVAVPLAWGIGATVSEAAALRLSNKLWLTLLPLLLGTGVCVCFYYLDKSRFSVRGVVGPYFSAIAILFALFASLLAAELWQRQNKQDVLFHAETNGLRSLLRIADAVDTATATAVRGAVEYYIELSGLDAGPGRHAGSAQRVDEALQRLYGLAADPAAFKGNAVTNAAFLGSLETVRSAHADRTAFHNARVAPSKFLTLLLFGLLTQIAIAFCHAGNPRALAAGVMLFSIAFSAAIGILALLDDPYEGLPMISLDLVHKF